MERSPIKVNLARLLQKSRQALVLYSDLLKGSQSSPLKKSQITEWHSVSAKLINELSALIGSSNNNLLAGTINFRDRLFQLWRENESRLVKGQKEIVELVERGDFVRCHQITEQLICIKASVQAFQAAFNEVDAVLKGSNAQKLVVRLNQQDVVEDTNYEDSFSKNNNVIPLRRAGK
jgi:hypothetical protein